MRVVIDDIFRLLSCHRFLCRTLQSRRWLVVFHVKYVLVIFRRRFSSRGWPPSTGLPQYRIIDRFLLEFLGYLPPPELVLNRIDESRIANFRLSRLIRNIRLVLDQISLVAQQSFRNRRRIFGTKKCSAFTSEKRLGSLILDRLIIVFLMKRFGCSNALCFIKREIFIVIKVSMTCIEMTK